MEKILTLPKAARMLGISVSTFRWRVKKGKGPDFKRTPGGHYRLRKSDVLRWAKGLRRYRFRAGRMNVEKLLSIGKVTEITGSSTQALHYWIKKGQGPAFKRTPGGHFRFREADVRRWLSDSYRGMNMAGLLSLTEAARIVGVSRWTLRWWVRNGQGPAFRRSPGGHYRFHEADVRRWLSDSYRGMNMGEFIVSLPEVAKTTGIHRRTLRRRVGKGKVHRFRRTAGGHYRFRKSDLTRWLRALRGAAVIKSDRPDPQS